MELHLIGAAALHVLSRKLLLVMLVWERTCRGISLVTQDMFLLLYVCRYLDLLYLFTDFGDEVVKLLHLGVALAIVMLMRFSPAVADTYDADYDTFPRAALILPTLLLACVANKVALPMEICQAFSLYLEAIVLLPQFWLMYKREKYDTWVFVWVLATGGERLVHNWPFIFNPSASMVTDPYGMVAAFVHAVVLVGGVTVLVLQRMRLRQQAGLNELGEKPAFDEVWEASKFKFDEAEQGRGGPNKERQSLLNGSG